MLANIREEAGKQNTKCDSLASRELLALRHAIGILFFYAAERAITVEVA